MGREDEDMDSTSVNESKAGFVTLLGIPNAGKSTLLNAMLGERLSIVSSRPQTTWRRITGIHSDGGAQIVFLDTPGLLEPKDLIHEALMLEARGALSDADLALAVLDPTRPIRELQDRFVATLLGGVKVPKVVAVTKVDIASEQQVAELREWSESLSPIAVHGVSGETGQGVGELLACLQENLPVSPFFYPEDEIATAPVRFFVGELVRETVFDQFREEIPYATFCEVEEFRDGGGRTYIQVNIFVERASQKGILIGERGAAIRTLGRDARAKIEAFLGEPVYLDLWVKVLPKWRKKRGELRRLGLPLPDARPS
ncbi:MAG: GTPase Era [Gemmatimonadales bacterium]|nr:MAG: GTPase Era [Gemmatimonadales bacterium]